MYSTNHMFEYEWWLGPMVTESMDSNAGEWETPSAAKDPPDCTIFDGFPSIYQGCILDISWSLLSNSVSGAQEGPTKKTSTKNMFHLSSQDSWKVMAPLMRSPKYTGATYWTLIILTSQPAKILTLLNFAYSEWVSTNNNYINGVCNQSIWFASLSPGGRTERPVKAQYSLKYPLAVDCWEAVGMKHVENAE